MPASTGYPMIVLVAAVAVMITLTGTATGAATLTISCGSVGQETKACQDESDAWAAKTGNTVKVLAAPQSDNERLALYQQYLAAGSSDIDIYEIDVIWPGRQPLRRFHRQD
jgi:trehalose/maltose transport system substrate-binding protein